VASPLFPRQSWICACQGHSRDELCNGSSTCMRVGVHSMKLHRALLSQRTPRVPALCSRCSLRPSHFAPRSLQPLGIPALAKAIPPLFGAADATLQSRSTQMRSFTMLVAAPEIECAGMLQEFFASTSECQRLLRLVRAVWSDGQKRICLRTTRMPRHSPQRL